ncbi:MAG: hypothetical protein EKK57_02735 [Proteobacteria bacterium]|nr:MAG: hypothetical protein EKK57_02735 [Pseudomonadota bacterium]
MLVTRKRTNISISVGLGDCKYMDVSFIHKLYAMATDKERDTDWYNDAYTFAKQLAEKYAHYGVTLVKVAHLIAAISPQTKWEKNKQNAELALQAYDAYMQGWLKREDMPKVHKFGAISNTGYAVVFNEPYVLGQKTSSFAANILGDNNIVTIDSLAMSILLGFYEKGGTYEIYRSAYTYAQSVYVHAAKELGISPAHLQAVTWVVCRRLKKAHRKHNKITMLDAASAVGQNPVDILRYISE